MVKKSLFNNLPGRKQPEAKQQASSEGDDTVIDYKKKPTTKKDPRIDTAILKNRIAEKIAKMNNH